MAHKPEDEFWVVILNEFTDAGIDALSVAQSARGAYDVRLVAGGCLCCVGELEFGKQLRDILRNFKPACILDRAERRRTCGRYRRRAGRSTKHRRRSHCTASSASSIPRMPRASSRSARGNDWSQIQSADVLLLSKPDLAAEAQRRDFDAHRRGSISAEAPAGHLPPRRAAAGGFAAIRTQPAIFAARSNPAPVSGAAAPRPSTFVDREATETQWQAAWISGRCNGCCRAS